MTVYGKARHNMALVKFGKSAVTLRNVLNKPKKENDYGAYNNNG